MSNFIDMTGQRYNRLVCIRYNRREAKWLCDCDCGAVVLVRRHNLIHGTVKSCGCHRRETTGPRLSKMRETTNPSFITSLYTSYLGRAKRKKIEMTITLDDFERLTQQNCSYCGLPPSATHKTYESQQRKPYVYNGLDRVDNSKGYTLDNVVPCCKHCNKAKNSLNQDEFLDWVKRVYMFRLGGDQ